MTRIEISRIPPFLLEAADESSPEEASELVELLETRGPSNELPKELKERVLLPTLSAPLRYAPFFGRLSELLGLSEADVEAELANEHFQRSLLPGIRYREIPSARVPEGQDANLVWMRPGSRYPRHRHKYLERSLIIQGGYTDSDGQHYEAGDVQVMLPGTVHGFVADPGSPCIAVSVADKRMEMESTVLRWLSRLLVR